MSPEWALGDVHDVVSSAIPERVMIIQGEHRRTYGEVAERSRAFAAFLSNRGFGAFRERAGLSRWQVGQDRVAVLAHNTPEHVEALLGCWRARVVPCNVNFHYTEREIAELLHRIGARGLVYDHRLAGKVTEVAGSLDLLVELGDGSAAPGLAGAVRYEVALGSGAAAGDVPPSSPDDLYIACTGGTTGHPKAVLWRQADIFVAGMGGADDLDEEALRSRAAAGAGTWFPTSPLMHVAAQWTTFLAANMGATLVLHDDARPFDVQAILEAAAREHVNMMTIVGDAYARPMIDELRRTTYDLSRLAVIGTGGAPTSFEAKRGLAELLPHVTIRDGYGASEVGAMTSGEMMGAHTRRRVSRSPAPRDCCPAIAHDFSILATARSGGWPAVVASRSATSTTRRRRCRPFRSSTACASRSPVIARSSRRTGRSCCSVATRSW